MKKLVVLVTVATTVYGVWRWQHAAPESSSSDLAFNRFWIDHLPRSDRDVFNLFVVNAPESVGGFAQETIWHGELERFRFEADGDTIRAVFPWSGGREIIALEATTCDEADWDYCLEVTGSSHGAKRYYSRKGWNRKGLADIDGFRDQLRQQVDSAE